MKFTNRQEEIIKIVKAGGPITSEAIAEKLGVTRAAVRADLAILTMTGTLDARPKVGYVYLGKKVDGDILENISKIRVGEVPLTRGLMGRHLIHCPSTGSWLWLCPKGLY